MALDDTDRRRFLLAAVITIVALPAIWWATHEDDSAGPNLATVGVEIAGDDTLDPASTSTRQIEPVGDLEPVFLGGPAAEVLPAIADIAVPAQQEVVFQSATYSSGLAPGRCLAKGASTGDRVRVVNLENNRDVTCVVTFAPAEQEEDMILTRAAFLELADLTDAPIPVELRQ